MTVSPTWTPRPTPSPDPSGPVEPLDVPDLEDIPLGDGRRLIIRDGEAIIVTDIDGVPVEVGVRDGGMSVDIDEEEAQRRAIERAREERNRMLERQQEARQRREEEMAERAAELQE